ncbi:MAG: hypothetical protein Q9187_006093 [Circinaria calcarea]
MDPSDSKIITLKEAMTTIPLDSHKYLANLPLDHCYLNSKHSIISRNPLLTIGSAAHGGLLVSVIISALKQHFSSTLQSYNQPHTFDIETVFLRPASVGKAVVEIKEVKLGANISTVHFSLIQNDKERIVGYASNMNLDSEKGISYPTPHALSPEPAPVNIVELGDGTDPNWVGFRIPWHPASFLKPITHFQCFLPVQAPPQKTITDVWMTFASPEERFTTEMLGSIADHWHRMPENYRPKSVWNSAVLPVNALQAAAQGIQMTAYSTSFGYPTLSLHMEVKKVLPPQGAKWLFMRARTTEIKNGRFDAEVIIMDEKLELVALSHQVCHITKSAQIPDDGKLVKAGKL